MLLSQLARPICKICNEVPALENGISKNGFIKYRSICQYCRKAKKTGYSYISHKKNKCDRCGFIPEHRCQLDVDHIDGDKNNVSVENMQTLCANCHRLKTRLNRETIPTAYRL